ncbi:752_t:CDS:2 [Gigaspora margarita]|uniref:752_t:CDS:1 n=1 Tax=Gigaspora margarita TaxID=4874 RepID=A0ABN7VCR8_GIGMA|nr:752_t:CDS:2 [Gigaspora margarita]
MNLEAELQQRDIKENVMQSDDENYYALINNPPISRMKGQKCQKHIALFNDGAQKSENLISTGSSNISNESIGVSGIEIDETQLQTSQEDNHNKDIQEQSQDEYGNQ